MKSYYQQLKATVLAHVTHYRDDFLRHDRCALNRFTGTFILGIRTTGTNLLKYHGSVVPDEKFDLVVENFLFRANERFFIGANGTIREVSKEHAMREYNNAKKLGMKFYA